MLIIEKFVRKLVPGFQCIENAIISDEQGRNVGWSSTVVDVNGNPFGGGCHKDKDVAIRIAIAETIERFLVNKLFDDKNERRRFLLDKYPSTCGFAVGFESNSTMFRSVSEACERWIWERWIDGGYKIPAINVSEEDLSPQALFFKKNFESIDFRSLTFSVKHEIDCLPNILQVGIALGIKGNGVFPGSRVSSIDDDIWTHALTECWRHSRIFEMNLDRYKDSFFYKRLFYFGNRKDEAYKVIDGAKKTKWTEPKICLLEKSSFEDNSVFIWRAICEGLKGWHTGNEKRFVF